MTFNKKLDAYNRAYKHYLKAKAIWLKAKAELAGDPKTPKTENT